MINNSRNILQQAVFVTLLAALAMYGLHYHIAKTLIHICAFLSLINIATCIVNRDKTKISLPKNIKIFIATLFISCISITLYTFLSEENVAQRFFKDFASSAIFLILIAPSIIINRSDTKIIEATLLISCFLMASIGIYDHYINNAVRTSGSINLSIIYATNMSLLTVISLHIFLITVKTERHLVSGIALAIYFSGIAAIVFSGSRGPLLSAAVISLFLILVLGSRFMKRRNLFTLTLIFSLASIYTLSETSMGNRLIIGFNNASASTNSNTSAGVRLELWQGGLKCIRGNPLSGTGVALHDECFNDLNIEQPNTVKPFALNFIHLHNDVINILVWMGLVIGTAFFSYLIYSVLFFAKHAKTSHSAAIGLTACISFLLSGLTNTPSMRASAVLLLFAILVLLHHQAALKINKS